MIFANAVLLGPQIRKLRPLVMHRANCTWLTHLSLQRPRKPLRCSADRPGQKGETAISWETIARSRVDALRLRAITSLDKPPRASWGRAPETRR
jgi:hypothetical protein